jgi:PAS domain S-box-containing protein
MCGYNLDELIGETPKILQGELTNQSEVERMNRVLTQGQPIEVELINYRKNGESYWVNIAIAPIKNDLGLVTHWIAIQKEITLRKKEEANLNRLNQELAKRALDLNNSNKELERFAYVASHDLQEPLRMVSSFLSLLEKKYQGELDETGNRYIHFAVDGAERMKRLIYDLLEYSRVSTNKETVGSTNMSEIVNELLETFVVSIEELNAVISFQQLPILHNTRRTLMFQLMQNLIGNALKYHGEQPPFIRISATEEPEQWIFAVQDNGIGIKPIFAEKIFVIFQRLHNRDQYSGTGIGLSICKKIVELHGGKIWVESELGKGATFYFSIRK